MTCLLCYLLVGVVVAAMVAETHRRSPVTEQEPRTWALLTMLSTVAVAWPVWVVFTVQVARRR